jgi:glucose-1-phosphate thymidylyltransferase
MARIDWPEHRGILLAGGRGTRLYPLTSVASKQLTAVYNKPMIYYSLSTLMMGGIREVLLISTPADLSRFEELLGDGSTLGIRIEYRSQSAPRGIAEALIIGAEFIGDHPSFLMLGDNLLYGRFDFMRDALRSHGDDAVVFGYQVANPSAYGVIEFDEDGKAIAIEEKPEMPSSNWAIPGLYVYPPGVAELAGSLAPSGRGELEITDLNRLYLDQGRLRVVPMGRGIAWFDTGSPGDLLEASNFIEAVERRQGLIIGSPEEVAYRMGYITRQELESIVAGMPESQYSSYLADIARGPDSLLNRGSGLYWSGDGDTG